MPAQLFPGAWRARRAARVIRQILEGPLNRRLAAVRRGEATPQDDIMASLMSTVDPETGTRFDDGELLDQIAMLFLAGHETSATAMAWSLYLLANAPDVQERVHAEAVQAYGERRAAVRRHAAPAPHPRRLPRGHAALSAGGLGGPRRGHTETADEPRSWSRDR